jgi:hypothetical protein
MYSINTRHYFSSMSRASALNLSWFLVLGFNSYNHGLVKINNNHFCVNYAMFWTHAGKFVLSVEVNKITNIVIF